MVAPESGSVSSREKSRSKVADYSDLTTAQKKRRALAACKKVEVRKFIGGGSEAKCSSDVNRGDFNKVIEALEYGL